MSFVPSALTPPTPRRRLDSAAGATRDSYSHNAFRDNATDTPATLNLSSTFPAKDTRVTSFGELAGFVDEILPPDITTKLRVHGFEFIQPLPIRKVEGNSDSDQADGICRFDQDDEAIYKWIRAGRTGSPPISSQNAGKDAQSTTDRSRKEQPCIQRPSRVSKPIARTRLVISLDLGTTYSGASYAFVHPDDDVEDVKVVPVSNWPAQLAGDTDSKKVPSQIAYAMGTDKTQYWGFDIPEELNHVTIRWFKLLLEPERPNTIKSFTDVIDPDYTSNLLKDLKTDAVTVAADYVRLLWQHVKEQIIIQHDQSIFDYAAKNIVMTVPSVWSDKAKHNTYLVAMKAGLADEDYELSIVAEPEAAAVSVLKDRTRTIVVGDVYILVDAGGGTVDLTTYVVKSISPLVLEEVIPGDGDICGAAFLTFNFWKLLRTYLGDDILTRIKDDEPESEARIIRDFEDGIRKKFDGTDRKMTVGLYGVSDSVRQDIKGGIMRFNAAELNPVFLPVLEKVERLIRRQITALKRLNQHPKAILLVGGFGTNHYMLKRLQRLYNQDDITADRTSKVTVSQPSNGWQSIANGAVLCEVLSLGNLLPLRIARYNVGISVNQDFDPAIHKPEQMFEHNLTGKKKAAHNFIWFLRRGDGLRSGHSVDYQVSTSISEEVIDLESATATKLGREPTHLKSILLVTSREDDAPIDYPTIHTRRFVSCAMHWDLSKIIEHTTPRVGLNGTRYRKIRWTIHMKRGLDGINFSYSLLGTFVGPITQVDFHSLDDVGNRIEL